MIPGDAPPPASPSDKLKAIVAAGRAAAAQNAVAPKSGGMDVQNLVDKNAALPDALALKRLLESEELERRLAPEDDESPDEREVYRARRPPPDGELAAGAEIVASAPMSRAELRNVLADLQETFGGSYGFREVRAKPDVVFSDPDAVEDEEHGPDNSWIIGALIAFLLIAGFLYAITVGPLRPAPAPAPAPSPSPSISASPR
jgi:hypothetical protein